MITTYNCRPVFLTPIYQTICMQTLGGAPDTSKNLKHIYLHHVVMLHKLLSLHCSCMIHALLDWLWMQTYCCTNCKGSQTINDQYIMNLIKVSILLCLYGCMHTRNGVIGQANRSRESLMLREFRKRSHYCVRNYIVKCIYFVEFNWAEFGGCCVSFDICCVWLEALDARFVLSSPPVRLPLKHLWINSARLNSCVIDNRMRDFTYMALSNAQCADAMNPPLYRACNHLSTTNEAPWFPKWWRSSTKMSW